MLNKRREKIVLILILLILITSPCCAFSGFLPQEGVYFVEENSGDVIFAQNENDFYYPASTTKLMTAIILLENIQDLNQSVICGSEVLDYDFSDSEAGLWENQQTNYLELLYAMLIPSGNDAAGTIAVNVGKQLLNNPSADKVTAQEAFVNAMNEKAQDLGLTNTHFTNPTGKDDPNHYTTPKDFSKIVSEAFKHEEIVRASQTKRYPITSIKGFTYDLVNTDLILFPTVGEIGIAPDPNLSLEQQQLTLLSPNPFYSSLLKAGKTGTTGDNSRTFVFSSDMGNSQVIGVLFNYPDNNIFAQAKNALDEISQNYTLINLADKNLNGTIKLENSDFKDGDLSYSVKNNVYSFAPDHKEYEQNIRWNNNYINQQDDGLILVKDINIGDKVGSIVLSNNNSTVKTIPIYADNNVRVKSLFNNYSFFIMFTIIILLLQLFFILLRKKTINKQFN